MAITKTGIKKSLEPFLIEKDGMTFLRKDSVDAVEDIILRNYDSVYVEVKECDYGNDTFVVGNLTKSVKKPLYEIHIAE